MKKKLSPKTPNVKKPLSKKKHTKKAKPGTYAALLESFEIAEKANFTPIWVKL